MVGVTGFEPATFATPLQRATKLRHTPIVLIGKPYVANVCLKTVRILAFYTPNEKHFLRFLFNRLPLRVVGCC